jgi:hypothetical protein
LDRTTVLLALSGSDRKGINEGILTYFPFATNH